MIQPGGRVTKGREEIEKRLAEEHSFFYKGSRLSSTIANIPFLKPDVAVVDGAWEAVGAHAPNGRGLPPIKGLYTLILIKQKGQWRAVASRTMVARGAPRTDMNPKLAPRPRAGSEARRRMHLAAA